MAYRMKRDMKDGFIFFQNVSQSAWSWSQKWIPMCQNLHVIQFSIYCIFSIVVFPKPYSLPDSIIIGLFMKNDVTNMVNSNFEAPSACGAVQGQTLFSFPFSFAMKAPFPSIYSSSLWREHHCKNEMFSLREFQTRMYHLERYIKTE